MNPFSKEYLATELSHYGLKETYEKNGLTVEFNEESIPVLKFDNTIWMTLKPKIILSQHLRIAEAHGSVLTGGLGLGYYPLRIAAKENVERVDVYELDGRVIDFFKEQFSDRPEMKKINLVEGDMRALASGHYDYVFVDIYTNPVSSIRQVVEDITAIKSRVTASEIHAWCEEIILRVGMKQGLDIFIEENEREYLENWKQAPLSISESLDQLYREACYLLTPWTIRAYLNVVKRPIKSYYLSLIKGGLTKEIKKIARKLS